MSTSTQTANVSPSISNFTQIFDAALDTYKGLTEQDLHTHPFAAAFDACVSPDTVLDIFEKQARTLDRFRRGDEKLMKWLTSIVHVLFTLSGTLGEGIGLAFSPAKVVFTGIGVLLGAVKDIVTGYDRLANLFEHIQLFLQRLNCYTGVPLTAEMTELLGKILAQVLFILAHSTKAMRERPIKTYLKRLMGRRDIEDALQRLDVLTKEEGLMTTARNLAVTHHVDSNVVVMKEVIHNVDGHVTTVKEVIRDVDSNVKEAKELTHQVGINMKVVEGVARDVDDNVKATKDSTDEIRRNQLREKLRTWLSPPSPSINHNIACDTRLNGTAMWLTQGSTFEEWKKNGSLLWIRGNPGSGKSVLCSTIIEDIKNAQEAKSALIAYHYFDFKDVAKRDLRGLLSSLLMQLGDDALHCWDILYRLFVKCRDGSDQPSETALAQCLKDMLELPGQSPVYIILDALDECPNATGSPSPRKKVLDFMKDLLRCKHSNLYVCTTSRPEQDITAALNPLTPTSRLVSLHTEGGQKEDINNYIRHFVHSDETMRRWRAVDKDLVIDTLTKRANGMFRWVYCQLDTLSRCFPPSIRRVLNELPATLDDTYERTLQGIPKEKQQHAHQLFQCLVAAIRPLRVEELAEIFTIEFDAGMTPNLVEDWRPENPEEAVLSACSTLISVIDDEDRKIVQFSHFSVKEFLTSDRFRTSEVASIRLFHISLVAAHTILARACLTVLLQLDDKIHKERLSKFPLAFYAAQHWVDHAHFEDVAPRLEDAMNRLFDPKKPYLATWTWIHNVERDHKQTIDELVGCPSPLEATPLYYAVFCGFTSSAKHLIVTHQEDVNAECGFYGSPLNAASHKGDLATVCLLLDHGADMNSIKGRGMPLQRACSSGNLEVMQLLLARGADIDTQNVIGTTLHYASQLGHAEAVLLLLQHKADVNAKGFLGYTPLHLAARFQHAKVVELLLEHGADIEAKSMVFSRTPLQQAHYTGCQDIVQLMLEHRAARG